MKKTLPPRYYLTHFNEFLSFFDGASAGLLRQQDIEYIEAFRRLSEDQQCIIVRAAYRKHAICSVKSFDYEEIPHPFTLLIELKAQGWFGHLEDANTETVLAVLPKPDLLTVLEQYESIKGLKSKKKDDIAVRLKHCITNQGWRTTAVDKDYVVFNGWPVLDYLMFLYFGHLSGKLSQFSMRDLGVMRTRQDAVNDQARFSDSANAQGAFFYAVGLTQLKAKQRPNLSLSELPVVDDASAVALKDKYLHRLGLALLDEDAESALEVLAHSNSDAATEKWVRESFKLGYKDEVKERLEAIIEDPESDTLLLFAEDFYERKYNKKRTSLVTDMLRDASRKLTLDVNYIQSVEMGVIAYYQRQKITAQKTENHLWRSLFGLLFWDLLFDKDGVVSQFDRRPMSLRNNDFYTRFQNEIDQRLNSFTSGDAMYSRLAAVASTAYGKVNSVFMWYSGILDPLKTLLQHSDIKAICGLMLAVAKDFKRLKDGYPDLMIIENGKVRFEEIKSSGDQIRRNQLHTIRKMRDCGFDVGICQVDWQRDPEQAYAVVDIETTGGGSQYHRITEIGIVKLVDGVEVDTWQTLINPQRHIPQSITRLTGISNDMVNDAPFFSDIAQSLKTFLEGCIFVAHNVNFDYGFIKQEFARLDQSFRLPKLCTVREMRRVYPGLQSYSLAALTKHFEIKMARHHRALSDAKAAAELLLLAHEKEQQKE